MTNTQARLQPGSIVRAQENLLRVRAMLGCGLLTTLFSGPAGAEDPPAGSRTYLYECALCNGKPLGYPPPGNEARDMLNQVAQGTQPPLAQGDKVTLCNNFQCVTCTYQRNNAWDGGNVRDVNPRPGAGPIERPPSGPPRDPGTGRHWIHICGTASGGGESRITCVLAP